MPRPLISAYEQTHGEVCVERWDCPVNLVTVEQMQVLRDFGHYRAGRPLYPVISDYPNRLLRQLEVVESEVAANTLALKEGA